MKKTTKLIHFDEPLHLKFFELVKNGYPKISFTHFVNIAVKKEIETIQKGTKKLFD